MIYEVVYDLYKREIIRVWDEVNQVWTEYYFKEWEDAVHTKAVYTRVIDGEVVRRGSVLVIVDETKQLPR